MRRRRSRIEAQRLVLDFKQSGLTRQAFCALHGLSVAALDKYRRRPAASLQGGERLLPVELVPDQASAFKANSTLWVGAAGKPRCRSLPSLAARPLVMSRRLLTDLNWQNSIATNWPQQVKPLALRSASCLRTAESKSARGINFNTWEKILHTMDKAASSSDGQVLDKPNLSDRRSLTGNLQLLLQNYCLGQE